MQFRLHEEMANVLGIYCSIIIVQFQVRFFSCEVLTPSEENEIERYISALLECKHTPGKIAIFVPPILFFSYL